MQRAYGLARRSRTLGNANRADTLLQTAIDQLGFSANAYYKVLRVARTGLRLYHAAGTLEAFSESAYFLRGAAV